MNQFSISINSAYAIFNSKLLTWIPKTENIYYDSFDFISSQPIQFDNLGSKKVAKIYCNNQICHTITEEGLIFSWGNDREKYGILGLGNNYIITSPTLNENLLKKKIINLSLSEKHCAALDKSNNLYTWGYGPYGELCFNKNNIKFNLPQLVNDKININPINILCGSSYTIIEDFDKSLIYFGIICPKDKLNLIKYPNEDNYLKYIPFTDNEVKKYKKIVCGNSMIGLIDFNGNLYIYNDYNGLLLVKIPYPIKSVKIIHNLIYALTNDYGLIYEFQPSNITSSIFDYKENIYNISTDIDNIDLIDTPYYDNVLFFNFKASKEYIEKIEKDNIKIFTPIKLSGKTKSSNNIFIKEERKYHSIKDSIINKPNFFPTNILEKNLDKSTKRINRISQLLNHLFDKSINDIKTINSYNIPNTNKIKLVQLTNGFNESNNYSLNGSLNIKKNNSLNFAPLIKKRSKSFNEKNFMKEKSKFNLKKQYNFIDSSNVYLLTNGNAKNMNSFRKSLTKIFNKDFKYSNDENGLNSLNYSSNNFLNSDNKYFQERYFEDNTNSIKRFNFTDEVKKNIEDNKLTFSNNENNENEILVKKINFNDEKKLEKKNFEENKYLLKFLNKNPSFQINKDNNEKNDINNYIKEEEDFDREFNIIENSNEKFVESNLISKKKSQNKEEKLKLKIDNYFLQKNLSNGMDKSNINNELINEIQSSNGLNNNIDKNNILLKNKINIKITPKKLYSTDSLKNISNNLSLNGTLKTKINSYNQINNNNKKEEELFNKIFRAKNIEENEKSNKSNQKSDDKINNNNIQNKYIFKKKTYSNSSFQYIKKDISNKIKNEKKTLSNNKREYDSFNDSNETKTTEKINHTRASTYIMSRQTSEKITKKNSKDIFLYDEKKNTIKVKNIMKRAFSHGKSSFSQHKNNQFNSNYTQEKPIMVLSENENLNSNGNNYLNNFNIFENCNLNNTAKNTIYQHKNLIENFSSNNNNEKKENKTNSHIIHFTKIIKKTINKKKFIKTIPINNSNGNILRETDNHFIIRNKNINQSELIKENNNINIKEQPLKLIYKTNSDGNENLNQQNTNNNNDNYNENINNNNNKENNTINNIINNNINGKKEEIQKDKNGIPIIKKSLKNISIMNKINKTEQSKISLTTNKTLNEIEKDIKSYILENMFNNKKSPLLLPTESPRVAIKPILLDYNQSTISNLEEPLELEKSSRLSSISNINHSNKEYQLIKNENNKF